MSEADADEGQHGSKRDPFLERVLAVGLVSMGVMLIGQHTGDYVGFYAQTELGLGLQIVMLVAFIVAVYYPSVKHDGGDANVE